MVIKRYLNVAETAAYTGIAEGTSYNLSSAKEIPHIKRGRSLRFDIHELDAYMATYKVPLKSKAITKIVNDVLNLTLNHKENKQKPEK